MEHTISTKDLKAKLDRKDAIKVVETLAVRGACSRFSTKRAT